jgi:hypothetical protein
MGMEHGLNVINTQTCEHKEKKHSFLSFLSSSSRDLPSLYTFPFSNFPAAVGRPRVAPPPPELVFFVLFSLFLPLNPSSSSKIKNPHKIHTKQDQQAFHTIFTPYAAARQHKIKEKHMIPGA